MLRILIASTALAAIAALACEGGTGESFTADLVLTGPGDAQAVDRNFPAPLSGREEVPPNDSRGTGLAKFQLAKDGQSLDYKLIVANIDDVTQAHIHLAPVGVNGGIVVFLFGFDPSGVTTNGILAQGTITADDLINELEGASLSALIEQMRSGNAYVNVHTIAFPPGEIRGQIKTSGPPSG